MQERYHVARGWNFVPRILRAAARLTARRLWVVAALVLAMGSAGQLLPAQAAPASAAADRFYMDVPNPKTKLCLGESVEYTVRVNFAVDQLDTEWALPGIKIDATSSDKSVGDFKKGTAITGFAAEDLVTASFSFTAKKAGRANLFFEGLADKKLTSTYVSFTVPVTVAPCKFKVITTSKMSAAAPGGRIKFLGVIVGGQVTADENGYFAGTAPVVWLSTSNVPRCGAVNSLGISKVQMRGNLNDSSQLVLDLKYEDVKFKDVVSCQLGSGTSSLTLTPSALNVTVPSTSESAVTKSQSMSGGPGSAGGSAQVFVIPVKTGK